MTPSSEYARQNAVRTFAFGMALPTQRSGITSIKTLRDRCHVDEDTGCWHWGFATCADGSPTAWFPPLKRRVTLGTIIGYLKTGKPAPSGKVWHRTCDTSRCCNPDHRKLGTRSSQMRAAKLTKSREECMRIAASWRKRSKLPEEGVIDIRASSEPLQVLADRWGIHVSYASNIRRGIARKPLGSSVFNLA